MCGAREEEHLTSAIVRALCDLCYLALGVSCFRQRTGPFWTE